MKLESLLRNLLSLESPVLTFQGEKMIRRAVESKSLLLMHGINDILQCGFAVALQSRYMYDLEAEFGLNPPRYYFISTKFLIEKIQIKKNKYEGVRIYFGVKRVNMDNILTLILTKVDKIKFQQDPSKPEEMIFESVDVDYYSPVSQDDGNWKQITREEAIILKTNFIDIVNKINANGKERYKTDGYFIGRHALYNVLSNSRPNEYSTKISKEGIKVYLGLFYGNELYNYDNDFNTNEGELQLILVGMNSPDLGPLASFKKVYATLETDVKKIEEGKETELLLHRELPSGGNCIIRSPDFRPNNPI